MAYTLADLRTAVLQRVDQENTTFFAASELLRYINDAITDLHKLLCSLGGPNYFVRTWPVTTYAGQRNYVLPVDLMKLVRVGIVQDSLEWPLSAWSPGDTIVSSTGNYWSMDCPPRYFLRYPAPGAASLTPELWFDSTPSGEYTLNVVYHPKPQELIEDEDILAYDYPEYLILSTAIKCQIRARKDHVELINALGLQRAQIEQDFFPVDQADAPRVIDIYARNWPGRFPLL